MLCSRTIAKRTTCFGRNLCCGRSSRSTKRPATAAACASRRAMRAPSAWWRARRACCATTIATGWATVCPRARPAPSRSWSARRQPTTRLRSRLERRRRIRSHACRAAVPDRSRASSRPKILRRSPPGLPLPPPSPNRFAKKRPPSFRSGRWRSSSRPCRRRISRARTC